MGEWPASSKPGSEFEVPLLIWAGSQDNPNEGQCGQGRNSRPRKKSKPFISTMGNNWLCKNEGQAPCALKIGVRYVFIDWCWLIYFECQTDCESSVLQYRLNKCELCLKKAIQQWGPERTIQPLMGSSSCLTCHKLLITEREELPNWKMSNASGRNEGESSMGRPLAEELNQSLSVSSEDLDWFHYREVSGVICKDAEVDPEQTDGEGE